MISVSKISNIQMYIQPSITNMNDMIICVMILLYFQTRSRSLTQLEGLEDMDTHDSSTHGLLTSINRRRKLSSASKVQYLFCSHENSSTEIHKQNYI